MIDTQTKKLIDAINGMAKGQKIIFESGNIITFKEQVEDVFIFDSEFKVANQLEYTIPQLMGIFDRGAKFI